MGCARLHYFTGDVALSCAEVGSPGAADRLVAPRVAFDLGPTGTEMAREVDEPLPPTATPRHPPIKASVAKFYDEPFSDLDREAA